MPLFVIRGNFHGVAVIELLVINRDVWK